MGEAFTRLRDHARATDQPLTGWYNRERIQARLGWQSPDEYEHTWHTSRTHPEPVPAT
jgi:transposase InsO family protein